MKTTPVTLSARRGAVIVLLVIVLGIFLIQRSWFIGLLPETAYVISTATGGFAIFATAVAGRRRLWSGGFFFVLLIGLFHLGIPAVFATNSSIPTRYADYLPLWLSNGAPITESLWLSVTAMTSIAVAYVIASNKTDNTFAVQPSSRTEGLALGGLVLVVLGAGMYLGYVAIAAPELLTGAGKRYYEQTVSGNAPIAYGTIIVSIGSVLAAAGQKSRTRNVAFGVFLVFTLATLAFGSRTAALYSVVAVVVVVARLQRMPRQRVAIVSVLLGLMVVSAVQQVRDEGLSGASVGEFVGSPASAATEMGLTLRPVVETVQWFENGEDYRYGSTYVAGVERLIEGVFGLDRPPSTEDERFAGALVRDRVDLFQIGYSIVAEAYLNFGPFGLAAFFAALGVLFGRWDSQNLGNGLSAARYGIVFVALIAHVRQASNITLTSIIIGLVAVEVTHRIAVLVHQSKMSRVTTRSVQMPERQRAVL
ncbi:O-antigen polymerase [Frigoribacterium sp. PvP032]|uniref:O-antigen polymerase n=1 Tax=Frigoribacterium sp. PvP032 TaxID=2806589 RepID=UPI001AEA8AA1|nr:O-antigen polymerase [Frigoribacterium sp. PvP032]MBP1190430.1 oligosaccharide repeat unit polymerase [Frigoribacterium sp. PvP032]